MLYACNYFSWTDFNLFFGRRKTSELVFAEFVLCQLQEILLCLFAHSKYFMCLQDLGARFGLRVLVLATVAVS